MNLRASNSERVRFGPSDAGPDTPLRFEIDLKQPELRRDGKRVELRPQSLRLLAMLVERQASVVPTQDLREALWGDQHLHWRNSLHQCVRDLRRALDDDSRSPRFVANVARVGYRFVGNCAAVRPRREPTTPAARWRHGVSRRFVVAFVAGVLAAVLVPALWVAYCAIVAS